MSTKESIVLLLGILLVLFIVALKNTDNIFHKDSEELVIGITQLPVDTVDEPVISTPFSVLDSEVDIPAFEFNESQFQEGDVNQLIEMMKASIEQESYFEPIEENAFVYLLQLKSRDLSEESLLEMISNAENKLIDVLMSKTNDAIAANESQPLTVAISKLKALNIKAEKIEELESRLSQVKQMNTLYDKAQNQMAKNNFLSDTGTNAYQQALQMKRIDQNNIKTKEVISNLIFFLTQESLRAAEESFFLISKEKLDLAKNLSIDSSLILETENFIQNIKIQRYTWLDQRLKNSIAQVDIANSRRILSQMAEIGINKESIFEYENEIKRMSLYGAYSPFEEYYPSDNKDLPLMVAMPVGEFMMGDANGAKHERPEHKIRIEYGFAISKTEISVAQFSKFIKATKYKTDAEKNRSSRVYDLRTGRMRAKNRVNWKHNYRGRKAKQNDPVIHVSWNDVQQYLKWISENTGFEYRLPSEAEFEYVLRAGNNSKYPWGEGSPPEILENITGKDDKSKDNNYIRWTDGFENYKDGYWGPAPVGSFKPNPYNLNDIAGNVMEWVDDCWHDSYTRAPRNGSSWANPGCGSHVIRGGSWSSSPREFESAHRFKANANFTDPRLGFRIAMNINSKNN